MESFDSRLEEPLKSWSLGLDSVHTGDLTFKMGFL